MRMPKNVLKDAGGPAGGKDPTISAQLLAMARTDAATILQDWRRAWKI